MERLKERVAIAERALGVFNDILKEPDSKLAEEIYKNLFVYQPIFLQLLRNIKNFKII